MSASPKPRASPSEDARRGLVGGWGGLELLDSVTTSAELIGMVCLRRKPCVDLIGNDDGDAFGAASLHEGVIGKLPCPLIRVPRAKASDPSLDQTMMAS